MEINIRKSIKENFKGADIDEIKVSINEAVNNKDEITLPGLGTFFELLWKNSDEDNKNYILNTLQQSLR